MSRFWAVLSDGTLNGDSLWTTHFMVPYEDGDTKRTLFDKWQSCWDCDMDEEFGAYDMFSTVWVITDATKIAIEAIEEAGIGDSYCYAAETARKSVAKNLAVRTIKYE